MPQETSGRDHARIRVDQIVGSGVCQTVNRPAFNPDLSVPYFPHQLEQDPQIRVLDKAARFWATGSGKSRSDAEDTAWLYCNGLIDAQLLVSPVEVHRRTWVQSQLPKWLRVPGAKFLDYKAKSTCRVGEYEELEAMIDHDGLRIVVMYYEALASKSGYDFARRFLQKAGLCKITLDESHRIMTPGSLASTRLRKLRPESVVRRIMTATPTGQGIEDLYAQYSFLDPEIVGVATSAEFNGMFVHKVKMEGTHFFKTVGYRNIKYLNKRIAPYTFVAKDPPGLPPRSWVDHPTSLSTEQWTAYNEMRRDYQTQLRTGHWVDGELSIVRLKRLQQIVAGHLPVPDENNERKNRQVVPLECPRIQDTIDVVRGCPHKVILWAQEHYEIERIFAALKAAGVGAVMFYGNVKKGVARDRTIDQFEDDPLCKVLVANDAIGGTGLTIVGHVEPVADEVFYSHTWSRLLRQQCEGRPKRVENKAERLIYHDMIAFGTTDIRIRNRRNKKDDIAKLVEDPREIAKLLDEDLDYIIDGTVPNV